MPKKIVDMAKNFWKKISSSPYIISGYGMSGGSLNTPPEIIGSETSRDENGYIFSTTIHHQNYVANDTSSGWVEVNGLTESEYLIAKLLAANKRLSVESKKSLEEVMKEDGFEDEVSRAEKLIKRKKDLHTPRLDENGNIQSGGEDEVTVVLEEYFDIPENLRDLL